MHEFRLPLPLSNLTQRVLSALIMAPLALGAVYAGSWFFLLVVMLILTLGLREWFGLTAPEASPPLKAFACASLVLVLGWGSLHSLASGLFLGIVFTLIFYFLARRSFKNHASLAALGLPVLAGCGLALLSLRATPLVGLELVLYLFAVVWGTDIGAYGAGRLIGGAKLAPAISPNKTWSGLFGGMALAACLGYGVAACFGAHNPNLAAGLALILAVVSQMGDLFESYLKRRRGVKESGDLIPGHGGVLDRIDGLIFASLFFMLFQLALGAQIQW